MKKSIFTLAITVFITGSVLTSCESSSEKVDAANEDVAEAQQDLEEAQQDYTEQYKQFKLESDEKVTVNEKLIADLKEYAENKKKEAKITYEKTIDNLEKRNQVMKEKVTDYKDQGYENWNSFKDEFNRDMNELGQALKDLTKDNIK